jgi:hypothetical protein
MECLVADFSCVRFNAHVKTLRPVRSLVLLLVKVMDEEVMVGRVNGSRTEWTLRKEEW